MSLTAGLRVAAAAIAAPIAGTAWWMFVDQISPARALSTPFPYLLMAISWFLATPVYAAASSWIDGRLWRILVLATIGAAPFSAYAIAYFLTPRDVFAASVIFSTAWVAASTFWLVIHAARRKRG